MYSPELYIPVGMVVFLFVLFFVFLLFKGGLPVHTCPLVPGKGKVECCNLKGSWDSLKEKKTEKQKTKVVPL